MFNLLQDKSINSQRLKSEITKIASNYKILIMPNFDRFAWFDLFGVGFIGDYNYHQMEEFSKNSEYLFFRLYVTYIEASREQLHNLNKQAYYRISLWENDKLLGQMMEGSAPAVLNEKIFLNRAGITFSHRLDSNDIVIKFTEYFSGETLLGIGMFNLGNVRRKYLKQQQRFFSLLEASLSTAQSHYKLVFSLFVEKDKYALDGFIKRFKQNEKNVLRAKRNINNYKKELLNRSIQREKESMAAKVRQQEAKKENSPALKPKDMNGTGSRSKSPSQDSHKKLKIQVTPQLEINSAAKVSPKGIDRKPGKVLNEAQEKQFEAYSSLMQLSKAGSHVISAMQMQVPSMISDGSEQSEMRRKHESETYSEKAIRKFKGNINIFMNVLMVIVAILLISFVITPTRTYTKQSKFIRKKHRNQMELFDI